MLTVLTNSFPTRRASVLGIRHGNWRTRDQAVQCWCAFSRLALGIVRLLQQRRQRGVVDRRILAQIQRRQMKAKALQAADQTPQRELACVRAAMRGQPAIDAGRSAEKPYELQCIMRISYAVFS